MKVKILTGLRVELVELKIGKGRLKETLDLMEYYRCPISRQAELLGVHPGTVGGWRRKLGYGRRKFFKESKNAK